MHALHLEPIRRLTVVLVQVLLYTNVAQDCAVIDIFTSM